MIPLSWSNAPSNTASFALTMHTFPNPDSQELSSAHSYIVLYDIPGDASSLAEGETSIGTFGINTVNDQQEYSAPCSKGTGENTYIITLYALSDSIGSLGLDASATGLVELTDAIANSTLETATLSLTRVRYNSSTDDHVPTSVPSNCETKSVAFEAYGDLVTISCDATNMTVTTHTGSPQRSALDADKMNVGINSWIGRVHIPQETQWSIPLQPVYLAETTSNMNIHHPIGITVEGVPLLHYAKETSQDEVAQLGQDYSNRDTIILGEIDQCGAHAGNGEDYHYHMAPICMMDTHDPSMPLAYMEDGIPLYFGEGGGTYSEGGTNYGGGRYTDINYLPLNVKNNVRPLDECNAYDLHGDGTEYVYYTTKDAPYTAGCFRGEAEQTGSLTAPIHWETNRLNDFTFGMEVTITDFDTLTFEDAVWTFVSISPDADNTNIPQGNVAQLLYRELNQGETGYIAGQQCYRFRYRLDSSDVDGSDDTVVNHCR